jgi:hypothetical protein
LRGFRKAFRVNGARMVVRGTRIWNFTLRNFRHFLCPALVDGGQAPLSALPRSAYRLAAD